MKRFFYILLLLNTLISIKAQNLVPNPGFEDYYYIPYNSQQIDSACKEWFTPWSVNPIFPPPFQTNGSGSSDYFNANSTNNCCGVPNNVFGYQTSNQGSAYCGFGLSISKFTRSLGSHTYKEYVEIEISENLIVNESYCVELIYSIANLSINFYGSTTTIPYKPIQLDLLLTDTIVKRYKQTGVAQPLNICATPNFETSLVSYKDTVNWIKVSGHFKAKGGERYLTIGNFECNPTDYNPDSVAIYIYIDDVKLYKCDPDSINNKPVDSLIIPNIFTPNADGYNDKFEYNNQEQWEFETQIYNRWGNLVFDNKSSINWDGTYEGEKVSVGVYFYIIKATAIKTGEIRVYHGTVTVIY